MSNNTVEELLPKHRILPVLEIHDLASIECLAETLISAGMLVLEVTLRSPEALEAIRRLRDEFPQLCVGAGSVKSYEQLQAVMAAGGQFAVSPGATESLLKAASTASIPLIPGVSSASEIMLAQSYGYHLLKLFPAESLGGCEALQAYAGPFRDVKFCPTGGINAANLAPYLALGNVSCVGLSYLASRELVRQQNWAEITKRCEHALALAEA